MKGKVALRNTRERAMLDTMMLGTSLGVADADPDAARWAAVLACEATPECGPFLYAVTTQGVFCRPGCPSRAPLRRNARFYPDAAAAEADGFRACRRCDPKGERAALHADAVRAACALIEGSETMPSPAALAGRGGLGACGLGA